MGMRWMGCTDVLWMGADMDACKEKHKGKKKRLTSVPSVRMDMLACG